MAQSGKLIYYLWKTNRCISSSKRREKKCCNSIKPQEDQRQFYFKECESPFWRVEVHHVYFCQRLRCFAELLFDLLLPPGNIFKPLALESPSFFFSSSHGYKVKPMTWQVTMYSISTSSHLHTGRVINFCYETYSMKGIKCALVYTSMLEQEAEVGED